MKFFLSLFLLSFIPLDWVDAVKELLTNWILGFAFFIVNWLRFFIDDPLFSFSFLSSSIKVNSFYTIASINYYIVIFSLFVSFFSLTKRTLLYLLYSFAFIFLFSSAMLIAKVLLNGQLQYGVIMLFSDLRYVVILLFLFISSQRGSQLDRLYKRINLWVVANLDLAFVWIIIPLFLVRGLKNIVEYYLFKTGSFEFLIKIEVYMTNALLQLMGYPSQIYENTIFIDRYWVSVIEPCLGIGVMVVFALMIGLIKSKWVNKILFILIGEALIVGINALRIAMLLIKVREMQGTQKVNIETHAYAGYLFYLVVFLLFVIYLFWFHKIDFHKILKQILPKKSTQNISR